MSGIVRANNAGQSGAVSNIETIDSDDYVDASIDNAHLANDAVNSDEIATGAVDTDHIGANQVTLATMAGITRGSMIIGDASGDPSALAKGTETFVLTAGADDISWAAASAGAVSRKGGNTDGTRVDPPVEDNYDVGVEASTTSTTAVDLLAAAVSITATTELQYIVNGRKTTGAVDDAALGIKINTTVTGEAVAATPSRTWGSHTANTAQSGGGQGWFGSRVANYQACSGGDSNSFGTSGGNTRSGTLSGLCQSAVVPIATITIVSIRAITDNSANTVSADELHVYSYANS